jgi:hypothetical protein
MVEELMIIYVLELICMTLGNYGAGQYSNFATQSGLIYIYPYAIMPGVVFNNPGTQTIIWDNNTGTYSGWGNDGKICNFVSFGVGNCGYMTFYGSGTQNGGSLQFVFVLPLMFHSLLNIYAGLLEVVEIASMCVEVINVEIAHVAYVTHPTPTSPKHDVLLHINLLNIIGPRCIVWRAP